MGQRLLAVPAYRKALRKRWDQLNERGLFKPAALKERLREIIKRFEPALDKNFRRWPLDAPHYYDANDFAAEVAIM